MSRSRAQRWIADGLVSVNRTPASRQSMHLSEGTAVEVALPAQSRLRERAAAEPVPLDVLYEDDALMAINKPAGMVVHPSYRNSSGTPVSYTHLRAHETPEHLVCRLLL